MAELSATWELLSLDNDVFTTYAFWTSILFFKMLLMSITTGVFRIKNKVFVNSEDLPKGETELKHSDEQVDRVRRAHMNDIENILPISVVGLLYVLINPPSTVAIYLYRIAATARILHTLVYAFYPVPQPARAICFFVPYFITFFMIGSCIVKFF